MGPSVVAFALLSGSVVALMRDVPKGECHQCEVTCFEDCALKYDREIVQTDVLLQMQKDKVNKTMRLIDAYSNCLTEDQCPCNKASASGKALQLLDNKKKGKCAVNAVPCASKCGQKALSMKAPKSLLQKDFPLHAVTINAFAKGAMVMDQCLKYCMA